MTDILTGKRLLIVDDEADLREPLVMEFEILGCTVFQAANGRDAMAIVESENIDAVISDIRMPGGDGVELLKRIKARNHGFPMVMLITGFSDLSREDAYDLGAEAILNKPFDLDEMEAAVRRILTPREELWAAQLPPASVRVMVEKTFESLSKAMEEQELGVGRGGMFLRANSDPPRVGEIVGFNIKFLSGDILHIEGSGVVQWSRSESEGLPTGVGVEFRALAESARKNVLELAEALKICAFIPKGASRPQD